MGVDSYCSLTDIKSPSGKKIVLSSGFRILCSNKIFSISVIKIKRVYTFVEESDGFRSLVDRLWPRGLSRKKAKIDLWLREAAPSDGLRRWFSHDPDRWAEFQRRYFEELRDKKYLIEQIKASERERGIITLLYSAKDEKHNNAVALLNFLTSSDK
ncbi:MAG: DUF488 family protein [Thaumarchaeota archaeon]|nr:DUF488 family protein [Nitrososphaerota archaeon]